MLRVPKHGRVNKLTTLARIVVAAENEWTRFANSLLIERVRNQTVRKTVTEVWGEGSKLRREGQQAPTETCDAGGFGECGVGATEGEVFKKKRGHG